MTNHPPIILASVSPRRAELLRQAGLMFAVVPAHTLETHPEHLTPYEVAQINAYRKCRTVAKKHPDALVLGADTIVCIGGEILGKPASLAVAEQMLRKLQGRTHEVVTAVCLLHLRSHRQRLFAASTNVTFRELDVVQIRSYLTRINPLDKAGAYAIQEHGDRIVENISGSYSNVVGLPVERVLEELAGWDPASYNAPVSGRKPQGPGA
jgi:septum formation protein